MLPMLPQCLSSELPLPCVLLAVELLSVLVDHDSLAQQLCSNSGRSGQAGAQLSWSGREGLEQGQVQRLRRASVLGPQAAMRRETLSKAGHPFQKPAFS